MVAARARLEIATHNLANGSTDGFTRIVARGSLTPAGVAIARGTDANARGALRKTGRDFDLAIVGNGAFVVADSAGHRSATRAGDFTRESDGSLRDVSGRRLMAGDDVLRVPAGGHIDARGYAVSSDGRTVDRIPLPRQLDSNRLFGRCERRRHSRDDRRSVRRALVRERAKSGDLDRSLARKIGQRRRTREIGARMDRAMYAAATGMAAQQQNLDTIADDLANADVARFKGSAELAAPGEGGAGTVALGARVLFTQGKLAKSGGLFDVAIEGPGFFTVVDARGRRAYTRDGEFERAADGTLRTSRGMHLENLRVPADALSLSVADDGSVRAAFANETRTIGRLRIAVFPAPDRLNGIGGSLFTATAASGAPRDVVPGSGDGPKVRFGMLERSNVSIVEAMMQILSAQRAYEANAKGVQAADEMLRIANNLQRG